MFRERGKNAARDALDIARFKMLREHLSEHLSDHYIYPAWLRDYESENSNYLHKKTK